MLDAYEEWMNTKNHDTSKDADQDDTTDQGASADQDVPTKQDDPKNQDVPADQDNTTRHRKVLFSTENDSAKIDIDILDNEHEMEPYSYADMGIHDIRKINKIGIEDADDRQNRLSKTCPIFHSNAWIHLYARIESAVIQMCQKNRGTLRWRRLQTQKFLMREKGITELYQCMKLLTKNAFLDGTRISKADA